MYRKTNTLRVGLAGLGRATVSMLPSFMRHPNVEIVAVADVNEDILFAFNKTLNAQTHANMDELCANKLVDAVYISTPTILHYEHVLKAVNAGKHVIVEKPMATSLKEAQLMIEAANRNHVHLIVGHSQSFEPCIRKMRDIVASGQLGPIKMIHNWHYSDWLYRPRTADELNSDKGGGVILRQGSHQFDIIRYIGGGLLRSVRASAGIWDMERPTYGAHTVFLEFEDGTSATSVYSGYDRFHTSELTYGIGEAGVQVWPREYAKARKQLKSSTSHDGEAELKSMRNKQPAKQATHPTFFGLTVVSCQNGDIRQSEKGIILYTDDDQEEILIDIQVTGRDFLVGELYDAVIHDKTPAHNGDWGIATLEVCIAVNESSQKKQEIYLTRQVSVPIWD